MRKMACDEATERRGKDLPKVRVKEEGKSEHGESGKGVTWGDALENTRDGTHIVMIKAHFHRYRTLCRRVKESAVMHVSGRTSSSVRLRRRRNLTTAIAAKSMGGWGAVYQIASMSSVRGVCTPSPQLAAWPLSMLRWLRCDIQDLEKSQKKKIKAFWGGGSRRGGEEEGQWLWNQGKSSLTKCHRQNESSPCWRYLENEKKTIRIKHLGFVDGALRYSSIWNDPNFNRKAHQTFSISNVWTLPSSRLF